MEVLRSTHCCGVDEVDGLHKDPKTTMLRICRDKYCPSNHYDEDDEGLEQAFILITDAVENQRGESLVKFIRENHLGRVVGTVPKVNPNSENLIQAWLWSPNESKLKEWFNKNK